jgi:alkyl sulfatase BDS1-like metallo-beta-lactamase superfamily hydrolase
LRQGVPAAKRRSMSYDLLKAVPMEMFLDCLAIRLVAERASGHALTIAWHIVDAGEHWTLTLGNAALTYRRSGPATTADATIAVSRDRLANLLAHEDGIAAAIAGGITAGQVTVEGDTSKVRALLSMLDEFEPMFNIVEP